MSRERLTEIAAFCAMGLWVIIVIVSLVASDYAVLTTTTPIALIAAGFLFGRRSDRKNGDKGDAMKTD